MGISISDAIENRLLSEAVIECIPQKCEVCGSEIELSDSLKQIYCPNRYCILKMAARLEAMAKAMKAEGFDTSTCREICKCFNLKSPYQVFLLKKAIADGKDCPTVSNFEKKVESISNQELRKVKLWEVVKLSGIPSVETIAYKLFDGYDNLHEAYNDIEKLQVPFIAEKLGLRNADTGVMAVSVYNTLIEYREELFYGETEFDVCKQTGEAIYIAINGGIQGFSNKSEYINYINNRYSGKVNAMLMNSVTHQIHALVTDGDTSSNKYRTACRLKEKGSNIIITDGEGLLKWLDQHFLTK